MIAAKDLRNGYDLLGRAHYLDNEDRLISLTERMYIDILENKWAELNTEDLPDDFENQLNKAGYITKRKEYSFPKKKTTKVLFFFKKEYYDYLDVENKTYIKVYLPELDVQIENKSNYDLFVLTSKGSNANVLLENMSRKEVSTYVERAYKIGALATPSGYISTSIIDKIDIKEVV